MNKTPFELRLDLLSMAQSILSEQNLNERLRLENNWHSQCETARTNGTTPPSFPLVPQYTDDQVIAMAEKLNAFVSSTK